MRACLLVLAVTVAGCFNPSLDDVRCGPAGVCPSGMTCGDQNICIVGSVLVDAGMPDSGFPSCEVELECPAASPGRLTVCGRFYSLEDSSRFEAAAATGGPCDPGAPASAGPCSLEVLLFDALDFANNPGSAVPIVPETLYYDDCGRFRAENMPPPALGFVAVGLDDHPDTGNDDYVLVGDADTSEPGLTHTDWRAFVGTRALDEMWKTTAGRDQTFSEVGAVLSIFEGLSRAPAAGVMATRDNNTAPDDTYYFSDTDPLSRTTVDTALTATGPNGSALMVNSQLLEHSGTGGEPSAQCVWTPPLAASVAGVIFVNAVLARDQATEEFCL